MNCLLAVVLLFAMCAWPTFRAQGADFPAKPIRWIVPFPPSGPSDTVARVVGERLAERLNQPVLIDNRAGASGGIGMELAARSAADGHTIVFAAPGSVVINPLLYRLRFDPLAELTAVSRLATFSFVLLTNPQLSVTSIAELLAIAKARPDSLTCGSGAALQQVACELLRLRANVTFTTVPYKGGAPAMMDLIRGQISFVFEVPNVAVAQVKANRVRAVATTALAASAVPFADLPRINETLPGFEVESWFGVLAPRATPREIVLRLDRELAAILAEEDVRRRFLDAGLEPAHGSAEVFSGVMQRDRAKYSQLIREAGIKADSP